MIQKSKKDHRCFYSVKRADLIKKSEYKDGTCVKDIMDTGGQLLLCTVNEFSSVSTDLREKFKPRN